MTDPVTASFNRWKNDLKEDLGGITKGLSSGRMWDRDFSGDIDTRDIHHAIFLGVASMVPAMVVAVTSSVPRIQMFAQLFGAPLQFVITGFLCSVLIFLGSHVNRAPKPYPVAFKLMLRVMAVYPLLAFLHFFRFGGFFSLLLFGAMVIRGFLKTYRVSKRNAVLFFGIAYATFALLQLQNALSPPMERPRKDYFQQHQN